MQSSEKLSDVDKPAEGTFYFCVQPMIHSSFGVYANAVLIATHSDRANADAHCERLRKQQAAG